jgi:hypothetical protein
MIALIRVCIFLVLVFSCKLYGPSFSVQGSIREEIAHKEFNKARDHWNAAIAAYKKKYRDAVDDVYDPKTVEGRKVHEAQAVLYGATNQLRSVEHKKRAEESLKAQEKYAAQQKKEEEEKLKKQEAERAALQAQANDKDKLGAAVKYSQSTARSSLAYSSQPTQMHVKYDQQGKMQSAVRRPSLSNRFARGNLGRTLPSALPAIALQSSAQPVPLTPRASTADEESDTAYSVTDVETDEVDFQDGEDEHYGDADVSGNDAMGSDDEPVL